MVAGLNFSFVANFSTAFNAGQVLINGFIISEIVLAALAILLNTTLLFVLYKNPLKRFRSPFNVFITSMALADTLTTISLLLSKVLSFVTYPLPTVAEVLLGCFLVSGTQSSFLVATCLTLDRFMAVTCPLRHKVFMSTRRACFANLAIWIVSLSLDPLVNIEAKFLVLWFQIYAAEILCLCVTSMVIYPAILMKFHKAEARRTTSMTCEPRQKWRDNRMRLKRNLTCTVLLITVAMVIFTVPYFLSSLFVWFSCTLCLLSPVFQRLLVFYRMFYVIYFGINPIIYAWRLSEYRRSLSILLCGRRIGSNQ